MKFGDVNEQLELVNEQIGAIPELQDGFDAIGFSQGTLAIPGSLVYTKCTLAQAGNSSGRTSRGTMHPQSTT